MKTKFLSFIILFFVNITIFAEQNKQSVITGILVGADGKPMPQAHVHFINPGQQKPFTSTEVDKDGNFKITTDQLGLLNLNFTGVNHQAENVVLNIDQQLQTSIKVRLKTYSYPNNFTDVKIIGDFNDFSFGSAKLMEKQADGTFVANIDTSLKRLAYQLVMSNKFGAIHSINGTQSDDYEYDGGGDYRSIVVPKDGKVRIIFDPKKIIYSEATAKVEFKNENSTEAKLSKIFAEMNLREELREEEVEKAAEVYEKSGKPMEGFNFIPSEPNASIITNLIKKISEERNSLVQQALYLDYIHLIENTKSADPSITKKALEQIPPNSSLWSFKPELLDVAIGATQQADKYEGYVQQVLTKHSDPNVKATLLFSKLIQAWIAKQNDKVEVYYKQLTTEFSNTQYGKLAKRFNPDKKIIIGVKVPNFSFADITHPQTIYTNETLKGKFYLIDFWATWCGPCLREMDSLHKAYEKFKDKNFEIISISFDVKPEDVIEFRNGKWKMPWLHSFAEKGFQNEISKNFEIAGIPRPILVDKTGKIIALDEELRGANLDKVLSQVLLQK